MERRAEQATRDRAILTIRLVTFGGLAGALGLSWLFANLAETYFSGKPPSAGSPPRITALAAPVQAAPTVITTTVHKPSTGQSLSGGTQPRPPGQAPRPPPPAPAPPPCHSTPSKPC